MSIVKKLKTEDPTRRAPPAMRAAYIDEMRVQNGRIVARYTEAIEDAAHSGESVTQRRVNERTGL